MIIARHQAVLSLALGLDHALRKMWTTVKESRREEEQVFFNC